MEKLSRQLAPPALSQEISKEHHNDATCPAAGWLNSAELLVKLRLDDYPSKLAWLSVISGLDYLNIVVAQITHNNNDNKNTKKIA